MELFLHPWYMAAGGLLVSAPILIHLINRMRFKRMSWAAMEFLLKSQKRNRRRLIIEQTDSARPALLCSSLLAGFLVARFVGAMPTGQGATHIVILDDTPSMADHFADKGPKTTPSRSPANRSSNSPTAPPRRPRISKCESICCPISIRAVRSAPQRPLRRGDR